MSRCFLASTHWSRLVPLALVVACSGDDAVFLRDAVSRQDAELQQNAELQQAPQLGAHSAALRDLTPAEAREDLEQLFSYVEHLYGPYEYKKAVLKLSYEDLERQALARLTAAPGDDGFYAAARWFLSRLEDAHVGLTQGASTNPVLNYRIGIGLQSVQGRALVASLLDASLGALGIARGDEVVSVDGVAPHAMLDQFLEFDNFANPVSNQQLIAYTFARPGFAAAVRPRGPAARVVFRRANGTEFVRDLTWREETQPVLRLVQAPASVTQLGDDSFRLHPRFDESSDLWAGAAERDLPRPFFLTAATTERFGIAQVRPSTEALTAAGINPSAPPDIYAAVYTHANKRILLLRVGTYAPPSLSAAMSYYQTVLSSMEGSVDALVLDQTHNTGGSSQLCVSIFNLFAPEATRRFGVAINADRRWIDGFRSRALGVDPTLTAEAARFFMWRASQVEAAYDAGLRLTEPLFTLDERLLAPPAYQWKKPMLVLIDELSASAADQFPMLIQANHVAPLFGQRTVGAGGSVEVVGQLANSNATLRLTRALFTATRDDGQYTNEDFVENRGILPDIPHEITVQDFRAGFVDYMTHFSDALVARLAEPPASSAAAVVTSRPVPGATVSGAAVSTAAVSPAAPSQAAASPPAALSLPPDVAPEALPDRGDEPMEGASLETSAGSAEIPTPQRAEVPAPSCGVPQ